MLSARGAEVIMAVRDTCRGDAAAADILKQHPEAKLSVMECDVGSLASVRGFADEVRRLRRPVNILINNAGVMATPNGLTLDGFETQFGICHIGHFHLTNLLLPVIKETVAKTGRAGNVVCVASRAVRFAPPEGIVFGTHRGWDAKTYKVTISWDWESLAVGAWVKFSTMNSKLVRSPSCCLCSQLSNSHAFSQTSRS